MTKDEELEAAYLAGFNASGEGYNGEYPFEHKGKNCTDDPIWCKDRDNELAAIKQARSAPVQEPVAWRTFDGEGGYDYRTYDMNEDYAKEWNERNPNHKGWVEPLYTNPPAAQRPWVGLDNSERLNIWEKAMIEDNGKNASLQNQPFVHFARAIESKLKEKNNG
jgi:hypothetical protein